MAAPSTAPYSYATDPTLFLYTSLTAGSSHIITATSRLETILKANRIPFRAIDVATDEKARMIWGRRSKGRRLPGLVRYGMIIGDMEQIEEWNEYRELKRQIANTLQPSDASSSAVDAPVSVSSPVPTAPRPSSTPHIQIADTPSRTSSAAGTQNSALRQASEEAAAKAKENARARIAGGVVGKSPLSQTETDKGEKKDVKEDEKVEKVEKDAKEDEKVEEKDAKEDEKVEEDVKEDGKVEKDVKEDEKVEEKTEKRDEKDEKVIEIKDEKDEKMDEKKDEKDEKMDEKNEKKDEKKEDEATASGI